MACKVSVKAYATADGYSVYPRLLIHTESLDGGPQTYCEYADGTDNNGGKAALTGTATDVSLGVGGSLDCNPPTQTIGNGTVSFIEVPPGYYDVDETFHFSK